MSANMDIEALQPEYYPSPVSEQHTEEDIPIAEVGGSLASVALNEKGNLYRPSESTFKPQPSGEISFAEDSNNLRMELSHKEAEIIVSHTKIRESRERISALEAEVASVTADKERLGQQLKDKENKLTQVQEENRKLRKEMETMKRTLAEKEQKNASLQERLHEAREEIGFFKEEHEARISRLEEGHRELECKVADSNEMLQKYSSEIKDLKVELSTKETFIKDLQLKMLEEKYKQDRRQSQAIIRELEKQNKDLHRQLRKETDSDEDTEVMTTITMPAVLPPAYT